MFKPLIPVLGFAVSSVANIFILIVFNDLGMLPGKFCDEIVSVRNAERVKPITGWCTAWKVAVRIGGGREHCLAGAAMSKGACPPQILRHGGHTSLET